MLFDVLISFGLEIRTCGFEGEEMSPGTISAPSTAKSTALFAVLSRLQASAG